MAKRAPRCSYPTIRGKCGASGRKYGSQMLCAAHWLQVEAEANPELLEDEGDLVDDFVDQVFEHPQVQSIFSKASTLVDKFSKIVDRVASGAPPPPKKAPPPPKVPPPPARRGPTPEQVLGIPQGTKITEDLIKTKRRDLAMKYHPDRGGDVAKMQQVNLAADALLARLKKQAHG